MQMGISCIGYTNTTAGNVFRSAMPSIYDIIWLRPNALALLTSRKQLILHITFQLIRNIYFLILIV